MSASFEPMGEDGSNEARREWWLALAYVGLVGGWVFVALVLEWGWRWFTG